MGKTLESMAIEEPEVVDEPESGPEVITVLVSLQEEISYGLQKLKSFLLRPL